MKYKLFVGFAALGLSAAMAVADEVTDLRREIDALNEKIQRLELKQDETSKDWKNHEDPIEASVNTLISAGTSSEDNEGIESLQGGGHDPKQRGFNFQQAELSFAGEVDPYFKGEAHILFLEDDVELEEAFITSTALPGNTELKLGHYLTEFGRMNASHPHTWRWVDQPVVIGRFFGPDGSRAPGARVLWHTPLPWCSDVSFGAQNADNETMASFLGETSHHHDDEGEEEEGEEAIGGFPRADREAEDFDDLVFSARMQNRFGLSDDTGALLGFSGMVGPNAAGEDTQSAIYGADFTVTWEPDDHGHGWPFVEWQSEVIRRDYEADEDLEDWGLYSQLLYGFTPGWAAGLRVEYATGDGEGPEPREEDDARDDRLRLSPLLAYHPSENSRVRLQYNFDDADHLEDGDAHTVWLAFEFLFGAHPSHEHVHDHD